MPNETTQTHLGIVSYDGSITQPESRTRVLTTPVELSDTDDSLDDLQTSPQRPNDERMTSPTREEMNARLDASSARVESALAGMRVENAEFRSELRTGLSSIATSMAEFRSVVGEALATQAVKTSEMRGELHKSISEQTKWIVGFIFVIVVAAATVYAAFKPSSTPVSQSVATQGLQPVIIQVSPEQVAAVLKRIDAEKPTPQPADHH